MTHPVLSTEELTVRRNGRTLLDAVDFELGAGEKVAVIGPNGAGKTSLLRCLTGAWKPDAGTVRWDGRALASCAPRMLAQRRAVVSQRSYLDFDFAVHEVVAMGLTPHPLRGHTTILVREALREVGAESLYDRRWTRLSGGEQQLPPDPSPSQKK